MSGVALTRRTFGAGAACLPTLPLAAQTAPRPCQIGADISWLPEDEAAGATYYENGVRRDPLAILRDAGFNAIKLRTFVDPAAGYSKDKPGGPWCDLAQTPAFGRRIKAAGFHFSVTLHYSDTWADPQHQDKPAAWRDLPFARLVDAVHRYTADTLRALVRGGAAPDMVVIGNETTFGMLWSDGRVPLTIPTGNPAPTPTASASTRPASPATSRRRRAIGSAASPRSGPRIPITTSSCSNIRRASATSTISFTRTAAWTASSGSPRATRRRSSPATASTRAAAASPTCSAKGSTPTRLPARPALAAPRRRDHGGRYDADPRYLDLYRQMARGYRVAPTTSRRP